MTDYNNNDHPTNHTETKTLALKFLKNNKTAVLATASRQGQPGAATVFYAIDDDFTFNFITDNRSRKWNNIKENPHVAIVVGTGPDVMTIQCGGHVEIIDNVRDMEKAQEIIRRVIANSKLHGAPPALPVLMNPDVQLGVFKVKPEWMALLNLEINKDGEDYPHEYIKVLP